MNLEETRNLVSKMFDCSWVKWLHEGPKPANNNFERTLNAVVGTILPAIVQLFETEEGQKGFEEWRKERRKQKER